MATLDKTRPDRPTLPSIKEIDPSRIFCNAIIEEKPSRQEWLATQSAGIWIVDRNMRVLWMNDAMENIYGSLKGIQGGHCFEKFRNRRSKCSDCLPTRAFESRNIITGFISRITPEGVKRVYQLIEAPLFNEANEVTRVMEIVLDVTQKWILEQALETSEKEYRALFDMSATATAVVTKDGVFRKINRRFEELSGYFKSELENKCTYERFIHPRDRVRIANYSKKRPNQPSKVPSTYEFSFIDRWGEEKLVQIWVSILPNKDQICSLIDLTDKHKLESEIRSKDQFLANILRYSIDAIIAIDPEENIRSWNHGAAVMFGYKAKDVLGMPFASLLAGTRKKEQWDNILNKVPDGQEHVRNVTFEAQRKDGDILSVDMTRSTIKDHTGSQVGSSIILRDLTEKRRQERRLIQQEKMLALGDLAASLAHEIKNPLNSMVINIEVLKSHLSDLLPENQKKVSGYLDVITSEVTRLSKVIGGVLDFARPMEGDIRSVDVGETLRGVVELVGPQARKSGILLHLDIAPDLPRIESDEDQLKQIFLNLILNGFQAMSKGGDLTLNAENDSGKSVTVSVRDTGVGIPRSSYKQIFDLYFSTKEKGSGLGLPLVKRLLVANGGKIRFRSKVNHGTTFYVTFPAG